MDIRFINEGGVLSYFISDIEGYIKQERSTFILDEYVFMDYPGKLFYNEEYIHEDSLLLLAPWLHKTRGLLMALAIKEYVKTQKSKLQKRKYSTSHRIEIAYKSKYKCNMCKMVLPPSFEVDHIVELQDGGEDTYENCQALCPNCHSEKTRCNILRRDKCFKKVYEKKFKVMQENAFKQFEYKSKYF